jgi:hypothetical protein
MSDTTDDALTQNEHVAETALFKPDVTAHGALRVRQMSVMIQCAQ